MSIYNTVPHTVTIINSTGTSLQTVSGISKDMADLLAVEMAKILYNMSGIVITVASS